MHLLSGAQILSITFISVLFTLASAAAKIVTDIDPLTNVYVFLSTHKLDLTKKF